MSLIAGGRASQPIVNDGLRFLVASVRADGSWPIDTNLATWVTTLAINAIGQGDAVGEADRRRVLDWLLAQQLQEEHPFTHAGAGGWAWTDLSGGVPDADDAAGALGAVWNLAASDARVKAAAAAGVLWLLAIQNSDGGIPTFCRGWGALPFDRSASDLTAHALQAWSLWRPSLAPELQTRIVEASRRALRYLTQSQGVDGSWSPLWFGNEDAAGEINFTYGTSNAVAALHCDLARGAADADRSARRGVGWLLEAQNRDGGWGGASSGTRSSIEETGIALHALAASAGPHPQADITAALSRGVDWIVEATDEGRMTPAAPIGLYFARLWYFEQMYPSCSLFAVLPRRAGRSFDFRPLNGAQSNLIDVDQESSRCS